MKKTIKRQSNLELLRIITMLMIVAHHFSLHGYFSYSIEELTVNRLFIQWLLIGGKLGINIFILISGYFLIDSESVKVSKLLKLWGQIFFYSVGIYLLACAMGKVDFSTKELLKNVFPISFNKWEFATFYFILYLISPYISKALRSFSKKMYREMLILLTVCWCIIPTVFDVSFGSNKLLWFIYLYSLAGYIRLYGDDFKLKSGKAILLGTICLFLTFASACVLDILGLKWAYFGKTATYFYEMQMLPIVVSAVLLFMGYKDLNLRYSSIINKIAMTVFGVYLIHDNEIIRYYIWIEVFKNASFAKSAFLIPYSIGVILLVFVICSVIESIRIHTIEKLCFPLYNLIEEKMKKKFGNG